MACTYPTLWGSMRRSASGCGTVWAASCEVGHEELRSSAPPKNIDATVGLGIVTAGTTVIGSALCLVTDRRSPESGCRLLLSALDRPRTALWDRGQDLLCLRTLGEISSGADVAAFVRRTGGLGVATNSVGTLSLKIVNFLLASHCGLLQTVEFVHIHFSEFLINGRHLTDELIDPLFSLLRFGPGRQ